MKTSHIYFWVVVAALWTFSAKPCAASDFYGFVDGYCTSYAARLFTTLVRGQQPPPKDWYWRGNAESWFDNAGRAGWATTTNPKDAQNGAIIVWSGGGYGHVGVVSAVNSDGITVSEMNWGLPTGNKKDDQNGITQNFNKVTVAELKFNSLNRGNKTRYTFKGYILLHKR